MKNILITGISGFAGSWLYDYLSKEFSDYQISGTYINEETLHTISNKERVQLIQIDLMQEDAVNNLIKTTMPDRIFHLAALAAPGASFKNPSLTITNNITAQMNILEAARKQNLHETKILVVSSADIYGIVSQEHLPIDENTELHPTSPYAVSKIAQDYLGLQFFLAYKLPIVRIRPFNHIGPRQSPQFVVARFAKEIAEIEKGQKESVLHVGNLDARRDFTDVRDMVRAYTMILEKGRPGEVYNIGSGTSYTIAHILKLLISFSKTKITIETDPALFRPVDNPELISDARKMKQLTGWKPKIPLEQTLKDTLDYWRGIV